MAWNILAYTQLSANPNIINNTGYTLNKDECITLYSYEEYLALRKTMQWVAKIHSDLTGQKIGHLTVLKLDHADMRSGHHKTKLFWKCRCDCGNLYITEHRYLMHGLRVLKGNVKGPLIKCPLCRKVGPKVNNYHGSPNAYQMWKTMAARCYNTKDKLYELYGQRGIRMDDDWVSNLDNFALWYETQNPDPNKVYTIARYDENKNFTPENCYLQEIPESPKRIVHYKRSRSHTPRKKPREALYRIFPDQPARTLSEWSELYKIPALVVQRRVQGGLSLEEALSVPWSPVSATIPFELESFKLD